jgi:hypothetical protein
MFVTENTDFVNSFNIEAVKKKQTLPKKGLLINLCSN